MDRDLRLAWDRVGAVLDTIPFAEERVRYAAAIQPLLALRRDALILEAGCGSGRVLRAIEALGFGRPVGLEVSMDRLREVRRRGSRDARLVCASGIPFAVESFDAVVSAAVVEHVENPRAWVHELARVTRRSGIVSIVTDTYMWKWLKTLGLYRPVQPIDEAIHPRHIIGWAQQAGLRLLKCGGFVNTPGQRLYLLRSLLRSIPGLRRIVRWFRRSPTPTETHESDNAGWILSALEEFGRQLRPGSRSCVWSYECFYWFEKS